MKISEKNRKVSIVEDYALTLYLTALALFSGGVGTVVYDHAMDSKKNDTIEVIENKITLLQEEKHMSWGEEYTAYDEKINEQKASLTTIEENDTIVSESLGLGIGTGGVTFFFIIYASLAVFDKKNKFTDNTKDILNQFGKFAYDKFHAPKKQKTPQPE